MIRGVPKGPWNSLPWCRETLVSRESYTSQRCCFSILICSTDKTICMLHAENFFEILLNQPEIRLYLSFTGWFGSKRTSVWIQINRKKINTIWFRVDLIRFRKKISVCGKWFASLKRHKPQNFLLFLLHEAASMSDITFFFWPNSVRKHGQQTHDWYV